MAVSSATLLMTSVSASSVNTSSKLSLLQQSLNSCSIKPGRQIISSQLKISRSRRDLFNGLALMPFVLLSAPSSPSIAREVEVGAYLPPSPSDSSFVVFQATPKDTPALRAGNNLVINFSVCSFEIW